MWHAWRFEYIIAFLNEQCKATGLAYWSLYGVAFFVLFVKQYFDGTMAECAPNKFNLFWLWVRFWSGCGIESGCYIDRTQRNHSKVLLSSAQRTFVRVFIFYLVIVASIDDGEIGEYLHRFLRPVPENDNLTRIWLQCFVVHWPCLPGGSMALFTVKHPCSRMTKLMDKRGAQAITTGHNFIAKIYGSASDAHSVREHYSSRRYYIDN